MRCIQEAVHVHAVLRTALRLHALLTLVCCARMETELSRLGSCVTIAVNFVKTTVKIAPSNGYTATMKVIRL